MVGESLSRLFLQPGVEKLSLDIRTRISADGKVVLLEEKGWKAFRVGAVEPKRYGTLALEKYCGGTAKSTWRNMDLGLGDGVKVVKEVIYYDHVSGIRRAVSDCGALFPFNYIKQLVNGDSIPKTYGINHVNEVAKTIRTMSKKGFALVFVSPLLYHGLHTLILVITGD